MTFSVKIPVDPGELNAQSRGKVISLNISSEVGSDDCFARNDVENVSSVEYSKESTALEEKFNKNFYISFMTRSI